MRLVDLSLAILRRTDKAIHVTDADATDAVWLPLSQVQVDGDGDICTVAMPEWLAFEKGLI